MKRFTKTAAGLLAVLLLGLSLTACKTTLKPTDKGLYDSRHDIVYSHASTVYEATELVKEYGTLKLTDKESYLLYTIPGEDGVSYLATEDKNIVYATDKSMPTLMEMAPTILHICSDDAITQEVKRIDDTTDIYTLVYAYTNEESVAYPSTSPAYTYKVRFESTQYPGFYYTLTYLEYAKPIEVDGKAYGRYFLRSAFDNKFVPVDDVIHTALGLE